MDFVNLPKRWCFSRFFSVFLVASLLSIPSFADPTQHTPLSDAKIAKDSGDSARALSLYKECLDIPQFRDAAIEEVTNILVSENRPDAAIEALQGFIKNQNPFNPQARLHLAELYHHKGDLKSAMNEIEILQKLRPGFLPAKNEKGLISFDMEHYQDAISNMDAVIADNNNATDARLTRAKAFLKLGQKDEALEDLKYLQANSPQLVAPVVIVASLEVEAGQYKQAETLLKASLKRNGNSSDLLERLGDVQMKLGETREAKDSYVSAVKMDPGALDVGLKLGKVYVELGDNQSAEDEFKRELTLQPDNDAAEYNLIRLYLSQNQSDRVGVNLKAWNQKYPEKVWSSVAYAKSLAGVHQYEQAVVVIQKTLGFAPGALEPSVYLAVLKGKMGASKEALKIFSETEKHYPESSEVKMSFGEYYKDIGANSKAVSKLGEISDKDAELFKRAQEMIRQIKMSENNVKSTDS